MWGEPGFVLLVIRSQMALCGCEIGVQGASTGVRTCILWREADSGLKRPREGAEEDELGE